MGVLLMIALGLVVLGFGWYLHRCRKEILRAFERTNVIVFGKKGTGKDLTFAWVVRKRRRKHYSNIIYDERTELRSVADFTIAPNDYRNLINGEYTVIPKTNEEGVDFYISDGGILLPSQYHSELDKKYPSFPAYYALSRHLANANIHVNVQNLTRIWDKIREQADSYFRVRGTFHLGRLFFTSMVYYEDYNAAKQGLRPFKCGVMSSKEKRALQADFDAKNGLIKTLWLVQWLPKESYDSRIYHRFIYGRKAPKRRTHEKKKRVGR